MAITKLEKLLAVYSEERELFCRMLALAQGQVKCVAVSNYTVLATILERRQALAEEISAVAARAQSVAQEIARDLDLPETNISNLRQKLPEAAVAPLEKLLAQICLVAEEIQQIDAKSEAEMQQAMQGLRGDLKQVQRGQTALRAYKNAPQPHTARFIDRQR